jgi:hypothetical protein
VVLTAYQTPHLECEYAEEEHMLHGEVLVGFPPHGLSGSQRKVLSFLLSKEVPEGGVRVLHDYLTIADPYQPTSCKLWKSFVIDGIAVVMMV